MERQVGRYRRERRANGKRIEPPMKIAQRLMMGFTFTLHSPVPPAVEPHLERRTSKGRNAPRMSQVAGRALPPGAPREWDANDESVKIPQRPVMGFTFTPHSPVPPAVEPYL
jgi:hypothetical protein